MVEQKPTIDEFYSSNYIAFCEDFLGIKPWKGKQAEFVNAMATRKRIVVKSCPGIGKTFGLAMGIIPYFYNHRPCKVITTAPTNRQVEKLLWTSLRYLHSNAKIKLGGEILTKEIKTDNPEHFAIGFSTDDTDQQRFQGFHSENILIAVDEANGVSESTFSAIEMLMTSPNARLILIGNPINPSGTFYNAFSDSNYYKLTINAYDSPNVKACLKPGTYEWDEDKYSNPPILYPGLLTAEWVRDKERKWGKDHPLFKSLVMGEFPTEAEDSLIPLWWVEKAEERYRDWNDKGGNLDDDQPIIMGCDPGHTGSDPTAMVWRSGNKILRCRRLSKTSTMETAGFIKIEVNRGVIVGVDPIGIGAGVVDRLREQNINHQAVHFGETTDHKDKTGQVGFINKRALCWWRLREALDPEGEMKLALPQDDLLRADLIAPKWSITSSGKIKIESKEEIKKRLGRSTDTGDALAITFDVSDGDILCLSADQEGGLAEIKKQPIYERKERGILDSPWGGFGGIRR